MSSGEWGMGKVMGERDEGVGPKNHNKDILLLDRQTKINVIGVISKISNYLCHRLYI